MSINLKKGQKVSLTKESSNLSKLMVGLGWEVNEDKAARSKFGKVLGIDCDAFAILLDSSDKAVGSSYSDCTIYYNNLDYMNGTITHMGDNREGHSDFSISGDDDEMIFVDLSRIPANINAVVFAVNIYNAAVNAQDFSMLKNSYIRIVDMRNDTELCRYILDDEYTGKNTLVVGRIERMNNDWEFKSEGSAYVADNILSIVSMFR